MAPDVDEKSLIAAAQGGDTAAFEELVRRIQDRVRSLRVKE